MDVLTEPIAAPPEMTHSSVLLAESVGGLNIGAHPDGLYLDGTCGGGGTSLAVLERLGGGGRLISVDRDVEALNRAGKRLQGHFGKYMLVHGNYGEFKQIAAKLGIAAIDGAVLDLGISSFQVDDPARGFSYMHDGELDMRMDRNDTLSAFDVVNSYSEDKLADILYKYGDERWAKRIAQFIAAERKAAPIRTTFDLVSVIKKAIPKAARQDGPHPAKRSFMAIRIEVNRELETLERALEDIISLLKPGARLSVITFHGTEDTIVKRLYQRLADPCTCPRDFPVCVCGKQPVVRIITRKPITPSDSELTDNHRARSAKLRVAERL